MKFRLLLEDEQRLLHGVGDVDRTPRSRRGRPDPAPAPTVSPPTVSVRAARVEPRRRGPLRAVRRAAAARRPSHSRPAPSITRAVALHTSSTVAGRHRRAAVRRARRSWRAWPPVWVCVSRAARWARALSPLVSPWLPRADPWAIAGVPVFVACVVLAPRLLTVRRFPLAVAALAAFAGLALNVIPLGPHGWGVGARPRVRRLVPGRQRVPAGARRARRLRVGLLPRPLRRARAVAADQRRRASAGPGGGHALARASTPTRR